MHNELQSPAQLARGNARQKAAYDALAKIEILDILRPYQPIVAGTIPIDVDIANSDIDLICYVDNLEDFAHLVKHSFGHLEDYQSEHGKDFTASFQADGHTIEIFAQNKPATSQNAYRHMVVENRLLQAAHESAREEIRALKKAGLKTEPAFAKVFQISGDPFEELLKLYGASDAAIAEIAQRWRPKN